MERLKAIPALLFTIVLIVGVALKVGLPFKSSTESLVFSVEAPSAAPDFIVEAPPPPKSPAKDPQITSVPLVVPTPAPTPTPVVVDLSKELAKLEETHRRQREQEEFYAKLGFSSMAGLAGVIIILGKKKFSADANKWAYSILGTILGYWLK